MAQKKAKHKNITQLNRRKIKLQFKVFTIAKHFSKGVVFVPNWIFFVCLFLNYGNFFLDQNSISSEYALKP
jgi:hypothetical protein